VDQELQKAGARIDNWFIAPYHPDYDEAPKSYPKKDRKPGLGMFQKAAEKYPIDWQNSYMAGDKITDLKPAIELGMTPFFIKSRHAPNQDKSWLQKYNLHPYRSLKQVLKKHFNYV
jgi:D-glycero-D-manno-heptose 1,7-bisphosphate phosphatase